MKQIDYAENVNRSKLDTVMLVVFQSVGFVSFFVIPWTTTHQASLSFTVSWSLHQLMSFESVMPSNHLILCHPLLLPHTIFPSIRVFSSESGLCIRWPKYGSWEKLRAGRERDDRGWDGWVASLTWWAWVWASSRRWGTQRPGVLQSMGSQRVGHDWAMEHHQQHTDPCTETGIRVDEVPWVSSVKAQGHGQRLFLWSKMLFFESFKDSILWDRIHVVKNVSYGGLGFWLETAEQILYS